MKDICFLEIYLNFVHLFLQLFNRIEASAIDAVNSKTVALTLPPDLQKSVMYGLEDNH